MKMMKEFALLTKKELYVLYFFVGTDVFKNILRILSDQVRRIRKTDSIWYGVIFNMYTIIPKRVIAEGMF